MGKFKHHQTINSRTDFFYYALRNILLVGLPLTIISGLFLFNLSFHSSARVSSSDNLSISVPSSCTLSSVVDEVHSASIINGTYEEGIGKTTLTTFCNDRNGYSVYAIGDSLNSEGNNKLVSNINSNYDIVSGIATNGDTSNWAMKLTGITTITDNNSNTTVNANTPPTIISPFTNYTTVPTEWTKVATITSGTTDMLQGSGFTTTYATYISPTQAAGSYVGQVKYLLTHPSSAPATNAYIMQEVAEWEDDLPNAGDSVQAIDIRDGKTYWVTRLADGHIWMTQNLDFDITVNARLSSETTDLNVYNVAGYYDGYSKVGDTIYWESMSNATTIDFTGTGPITGWQNSNTEPYSASKTDNAGIGHNSLGNWYNFTAAIASNNSNFTALKADTLSDISNNPQNSICPKGWRLPTISNQAADVVGSTDEFARINYLYNGNSTTSGLKLMEVPLYFLENGYVRGNNSGSLQNSGSYAYYHSSTIKDASNSYALWFYNGEVNVRNNDLGRDRGMAIRCVAR